MPTARKALILRSGETDSGCRSAPSALKDSWDRKQTAEVVHIWRLLTIDDSVGTEAVILLISRQRALLESETIVEQVSKNDFPFRLHHGTVVEFSKLNCISSHFRKTFKWTLKGPEQRVSTRFGDSVRVGPPDTIKLGMTCAFMSVNS